MSLGQVLGADPIVQAPASTQSFNRYSYTFNNPLRYTDPSGYDAGRYFYTFQNINDFYSDSDGRYTGGGTGSLSRGAAAGMADSAGSVRSGSRTERRRPASNPRHAPGRESPQCDMVPTCGAAGVEGADSWFGLSATSTTEFGTRYLVNEEPPALTELRRKYPEWRMMEDQLWLASLPKDPFGRALERFGLGRRAREHGMFVFQNDNDQLKFKTFVADDRTPNAIQGSFAVPQGYELIAVFHTHPFPHGGVLGGYRRGPSGGVPGPYNDDADTARAYPAAFHYIRALGHWTRPYPYETYYYGARTEFP